MAMVSFCRVSRRSTRTAGRRQDDRAKLIGFAGILAIALIMAAAQRAPAADAPEQSGPWLVYPCVRVGQPPTIDGRLDDAAWFAAVPVSGFRYSSATNPKLVPYQMLMRLCWSGDWLYMGVKVEEPNMDKLVITAHRRDEYVFNDDSIEWFIDPAHSHSDFYQFGLNVAGAMWDAHVPNVAWDCDWRAAVARGPDAWFAEIAIPIRALSKFAPKTGTIWGFNLCHERQAGGHRELINWANVQGNFHNVELFGHLLFVERLCDLTPGLIRRAADEAGRPTRIFVREGWWQVNGNARLIRYTDDLREAATEKIDRALRELRRTIDRDAQPELWAKYRALRDRWRQVRRKAVPEGELGPVEWAKARIAIEEIEAVLPDLLWQARLDALIRQL